MNKRRIKHILFNLLNPVPLRNKRNRIVANQLIFLLVLFGLYYFPFSLYATTAQFGRFNIYTNDSIWNHKLSEEINKRLKENGLNIDNEYDIFIAETDDDYKTLNYGIFDGSIGKHYFFINRIVVTSNLNSRRSPADVIAHELTHGYLAQEYGLITALRVPKWKQEGCAEYVAGASSLTETEGMNIMLNDSLNALLVKMQEIEKWRYQYYEWRKVAEYLIDVEQYSIKKIIEEELNYPSIRQKAIDHYKSEAEKTLKT